MDIPFFCRALLCRLQHQWPACLQPCHVDVRDSTSSLRGRVVAVWECESTRKIREPVIRCEWEFALDVAPERLVHGLSSLRQHISCKMPCRDGMTYHTSWWKSGRALLIKCFESRGLGRRPACDCTVDITHRRWHVYREANAQWINYQY